ncbi:MAG TPA: GDP-mannose 4,6-dehydratase, partial [Rhodothermales bacterium]
AINCLNHLRQTGGRLIFLSSSRVYPIEPLRDLPLEERQSRFALEKGNAARGWSSLGINENFPLAGVRSLYGATKLAAELLIQEYGSMYDMPAVVNRCGVIAGPWQMGKVDQGFVALWVARHFFGRELSYIGFGGSGRQVRDVLDIRDLFDLIVLQMSKLEICGGHIYNVGGGVDRSTSLVELTKLTQEVTGRSIIVGRNSKTTVADVPYYVSDNSRVSRDLGWTPKRTTRETIESIYEWLQDNTEPLRALFDPNCP